jgi:hypothetical protein
MPVEEEAAAAEEEMPVEEEAAAAEEEMPVEEEAAAAEEEMPVMEEEAVAEEEMPVEEEAAVEEEAEEEATGVVKIPARRKEGPIVTHVPASGTPELQEAIDLYNVGKFDTALTRFKDYAKRNPSPEVYWLIGYALYKLERDDEANKYFDYAYLINPDYSPTPALEEKLDRPLDVARPGRTPAPMMEEPRERELPPVIGGPTEEPGVTATPTEEPVAPVEAPEAPAPEEAQAEPAAPAATEKEAVPPPPAPAVQEPVEEAKPAEGVAPTPAPPAPAPAPAPKAAPVKPFAKPTLLERVKEAVPNPLFLYGGVALIGVLYVVVCLLIFRKARKSDVSMAWLSFIPLVQVLPLIKSAKSGATGTAAAEDEGMPDLSGEPPIPDLDFDLDEEEPRSPAEDDFDIPEDIEEPKAAEPEDIEEPEPAEPEDIEEPEPADQRLAEAPEMDDFLTDNAFLEDEEEEEANKE